MRALSLFSGIGGLDLAAEWAGIAVVGQVELDAYCRAVLAKHWPGVARMADVREVRGDEFGAVDLIMGGIPCQPWSVAGRRRGAADDRHLWPEMLRVVEAVRPAWVLVENVAGFVRLALDGVSADLEGRGYACRAFVLPACAVGAPHLRERVFVVAHAAHGGLRRRGASRDARQPPRGGEGVEYASGARRQERRAAAVAATAGHTAGRRDAGDLGEPQGTGRTERDQRASRAAIGPRGADVGQAQPGMGGEFDGLPRGLDGAAGGWLRHAWPVGPDREQEPWEPPRTVTGRIDHRAARLRALGNAVVPQQAYPVFAAIVAAEGEAIDVA